MNADASWSQVVLIVLSMGAVLSPILFGYILWKMSQVFVSKQEFGDYKTMADERRAEISDRLARIQENVIELLRKSAAMEVILNRQYNGIK